MSVARVWLRPYRVPLPEPWPSAEGPVRERAGALLLLEEDEGAVGVGETAPWPGFGVETIASSEAALRLAARRLLGLPREHYLEAIADLPRLAQVASVPCARHAVDLALHDIAARHAGVPVSRLLGGGAALTTVGVNAAIPRLSAAESARAAADAVARGARTIKLKVGGRDAKDDAARVSAVREAVGSAVKIRVDANQAWTEADAVASLRAMATYDLEYCEQPVAADDVEALARVRAAAGVPIAADEAVRDLAGARRILDLGAADVLLVKPMALGGLHAARGIAALAAERGIPVVVTSLLEGPIGRSGALHLAASLGPGPYDHGIATGVEYDAGVAVEGALSLAAFGAVPVPQTPGLGAAIDAETRRGAQLLAAVEALA
jgi:o-succinylbenzoate synthase